MEGGSKRVKTHSFENPQEAQSYMAFVTRKGLLPLTADLWLRIMIQNEDLSLRDVEMLCSLNRDFRAICKEKEIWKQLFEKQVPKKDRDIIVGGYLMVSNGWSPLDYKRLIYLWRIYNRPMQIRINGGTESGMWSFRKVVGNIEFEITIKHLYEPDGEDESNTHVMGRLKAKALDTNFFSIASIQTYLSDFDDLRSFLVNDLEFTVDDNEDDDMFDLVAPDATDIARKALTAIFQMNWLGGYTFNGGKEAGINSQICQRIGCVAPAERKCALCDTIYCSDDCGKLDWAMHDAAHF